MVTEGNKELIHDSACEMYVLGTIMMSHQTMAEVSEYLDEECFYDFHHKDIWKAINIALGKGNSPSLVNVTAELGAMRSPADMVEVGRICQCVTHDDLTQYAIRLKELKARRKLWVLGQQLVSSGTNETVTLDDLHSDTTRLLEEAFLSTSAKVQTLTETFKDVFEIVNRNITKQTYTTGSPTGFSAIDHKGGLQPTDLVIVAGESSQGKTSWAINAAFNASQAGDGVVIYSMEMMATQLAARILSSRSGVASSSILYNGNLPEADYHRLDDAVSRINGDNIYFDDNTTASLDSILNSIRMMKAKHDIKGAVVDYLQILNVNQRNVNPEQAMGEAARKLKNIAKDLKIWIIALSQLSRDKDNPRPTRNRLRQSGQIYEAADTVIFIYRPEVYGKSMPAPFEGVAPEGKAFIDIDKGRNIGTFSFVANFNAATTTFSDFDGSTTPSPTDPFASHPDFVRDDAPF